MTCTIRTYRPGDLEELVALENAADRADQTQEGTSIQEMKDLLSMPGLAPERNVFIAEEDDGRIVGYGLIWLRQSEDESFFRGWYQVHPIRRGRGLEERILSRVLERAQERLPECTTQQIGFSTHANGPDKSRIAVLERFGLREVRQSWQMLRSTLDELPEPRLPGNMNLRAYCMKEDDVEMHRADTEVFRDHWGHVDNPLEMWQHYVSQPMFKPDLSIIARDASGEIAGFCIVAVNDDENRRLGTCRGWIDILGVRRSYRRNGLGTALILQGLHNLHAAGLSQAVLGCDAENLTGANRIYERVGFKVDKIRIIFRKDLRPAQPATRIRAAEQIGSYVSGE